MTKIECLNRAAAARHGARVASERAAVYLRHFGGGDKLTQDALRDVDVAAEVARRWTAFASLHPATRAKQLRECSLPAYMFNPY
jgi:hypothetical protein